MKFLVVSRANISMGGAKSEETKQTVATLTCYQMEADPVKRCWFRFSFDCACEAVCYVLDET